MNIVLKNKLPVIYNPKDLYVVYVTAMHGDADQEEMVEYRFSSDEMPKLKAFIESLTWLLMQGDSRNTDISNAPSWGILADHDEGWYEGKSWFYNYWPYDITTDSSMHCDPTDWVLHYYDNDGVEWECDVI